MEERLATTAIKVFLTLKTKKSVADYIPTTESWGIFIPNCTVLMSQKQLQPISKNTN